MKKQLFNNKGEKISGITEISNPDYKDSKGFIKWNVYLKDADEKGFYKKFKYKNGKHTQQTILNKGTVLIRYGDIAGRFMADDGTPYKKLSLPYKENTVEFHKYIVVFPFEVEEGLIAPGFDNINEEAQATQYFSAISIYELLDKFLKEDFTWLNKLN